MQKRIVNTLLCTLLICLGNVVQAADVKPLKVFVLAGQSNMQGHAHIRTMKVIAHG